MSIFTLRRKLGNKDSQGPKRFPGYFVGFFEEHKTCHEFIKVILKAFGFEFLSIFIPENDLSEKIYWRWFADMFGITYNKKCKRTLNWSVIVYSHWCHQITIHYFSFNMIIVLSLSGFLSTFWVVLSWWSCFVFRRQGLWRSSRLPIRRGQNIRSF